MKQQLVITLFLIALLSCVLQNCKEPGVDCPPDEQNFINLTADDLSKVPYTGTDTLYFLGRAGDTNIVVGQGKTYFYDREYLHRHPSCPNNGTNEYQGYKMVYTPIKGNLSFEFSQKKFRSEIVISRSSYAVDFIEQTFMVGGQNLNDPRYIDSITINNIKYGRLRKCYSQIRQSFDYDTSYTLYYNKSHGILYMKSVKENEEYSILEKP